MKRLMKKMLATFCMVAIVWQMIPATLAVDLAADVFGEQVISEEALQTLEMTKTEGILKTRDNHYLKENGNGGYIVMEKNDLSFSNKVVLQKELQELDIPDDLKQSIIDRYELLSSAGATDGVEVAVYVGKQEVNSNGRSFYDDLPTITYQGRQFKVYTVSYVNIKGHETIKEGTAVKALLKNITSFSITMLGIPAGDAAATTLGLIGGGMTLFDICQAVLDFEITGSLQDEHWLDMTYNAVENIYYIYSEVASGWNRVLRTQSVDMTEITFTTYLCDNSNPTVFEGKIADKRTYRNVSAKTASFDNPLPVALQYQSLGKDEELSYKYQGKRIYF